MVPVLGGCECVCADKVGGGSIMCRRIALDIYGGILRFRRGAYLGLGQEHGGFDALGVLEVIFTWKLWMALKRGVSPRHGFYIILGSGAKIPDEDDIALNRRKRLSPSLMPGNRLLCSSDLIHADVVVPQDPSCG